MSNILGVVISDIHFNLNNLDVASQALQAAVDKANELKTKLIIAGDLNDTKAIVRGEVINVLQEILSDCNRTPTILVGNHDRLNEREIDHSLNFLDHYAHIIKEPLSLGSLTLIPYQTSEKEFLKALGYSKIVICHQGFKGAQMGDYVIDKTSLDVGIVKDYTVISGHYHRHQTIGTVTYIGSPYTMTFGEANDGPKGFLILKDDGTYTREILNLRKHVIVERDYTDLSPIDATPEDFVWLKLSGPTSELKKLSKVELGKKILGHSNFKLDLLGSTTETLVAIKNPSNLTQTQVFNKIIESSGEEAIQQKYLKELYLEILDDKT